MSASNTDKVYNFKIEDQLSILRDAMNIRLHAEDFVKVGLFESVEQAHQYAYAILDGMIGTDKQDV